MCIIVYFLYFYSCVLLSYLFKSHHPNIWVYLVLIFHHTSYFIIMISTFELFSYFVILYISLYFTIFYHLDIWSYMVLIFQYTSSLITLIYVMWRNQAEHVKTSVSKYCGKWRNMVEHGGTVLNRQNMAKHSETFVPNMSKHGTTERIMCTGTCSITWRNICFGTWRNRA